MRKTYSPVINKAAALAWGAVLALLILGSVLLLALFASSYGNARALADRFAKDGTMETFSHGFYQAARLPALIVAGGLLILTIMIVLQRSRVMGWIKVTLVLPGRLFQDGIVLLSDLKKSRLPWTEAGMIFGLVFLAVVARLAFIMRPFEHDEAYTVVNFAAPPLREGLSNYFLPNNHLFHTLLLHGAYLLWGYQPWAMRFPAFAAGVLGVPLVYYLTRFLYNRAAAVVAAAGAAALPVLVYFGTNARGYTLIIDFTLLIFLLAVYLRQRPNAAAWALFALFSALGMYTVPVFLYPFGAVMSWLVVSMLIGDIGDAYGRWGMLKWLVAAGAAAGLLSLLLYLPVFLRSDIHPLVFKDMSGPKMEWIDFFQESGMRMRENAAQLLMGLPQAMGWVLGIGFVLSLVPWTSPERPSAFARWRIPVQIVTVVVTSALVIGMRAMPYARFFVFFVPLLLMWAAAGWVGLASLLQKRVQRLLMTACLAGLAVAAAVVGTGWCIAGSPETAFNYRGDVEQVSLFLQSQMQDNDLIVVNSPHDAQLWYYSRLHGINPDHFKRELPFFRAFVIVDPSIEQTLESVMHERGPEAFFFDFNAARKVYQSGSIQVMEMIPYQDLIRSQYHLP